VAKAIKEVSKSLEMSFSIVPDDTDAIQCKLREWSDQGVALILTTGGTGMSPRDVTPEATRAVLDLECAGLMSFVTTECAHQQPLASLSRGTAGVRGQTLIANLPGNPKGVGEVVPLLLPLLLHAVADLQAEQ
jgi:molybdenum cofactor synthesis domain-containing protein